MADHVTVRQGVDPESLDDQGRTVVEIQNGASEVNVVLGGKLVIQIMISNGTYTIFDAVSDGKDGSL